MTARYANVAGAGMLKDEHGDWVSYEDFEIMESRAAQALKKLDQISSDISWSEGWQSEAEVRASEAGAKLLRAMEVVRDHLGLDRIAFERWREEHGL